MTLACEDVNSKLVEVVTVVDVDAEDNVGNSLLQIWELTFGHKAKLCSDVEHKVWSRFSYNCTDMYHCHLGPVELSSCC